MAENQVVFRKYNRRLQAWYSKYKQVARDENEPMTSQDEEKPFSFYCECSDENCQERIDLTPDTYNKIHRSSNAFTIVPGHEVPSIEDVVQETADYCVVKKHLKPPQNIARLNVTKINNG